MHFRSTLSSMKVMAIIGFCALVGQARPLHAQRASEATDATLRADCRLATQAIEAGHPSPKWSWALETLLACEQSAGAAMAIAWRSAPDDSVALTGLVRLSQAVRDGRIFEATLVVASNPANGWWRRAAAMRVLGAYVDPGVLFKFDDLRPRADSSLRYASAQHSEQRLGSTPVPPTATTQILALLSQAATMDPDSAIRFTADHMHAILKSRAP